VSDAARPRPGPDDLPTAARDRVVALLETLAADRAALAAAGESGGVASYDALIDAARAVLQNLDRQGTDGSGSV
jgi:hypothetical protein